MKQFAGAGLIALLAGSIATAAENDLQADIIEVTGLRAQLPEDVTASVTVIEAAQLALRNAPFLADVLRAVPGAAVSRSGAFGGLTQLRLRGAEANHTLVLIDGIEASDPVTGETDFGLWSGLGISRIEAARGEQSALYGSDAIGGVVSVTTGGDGFRAAAEAGSRQTARLSLGGTYQGDAGYLGAAVAGFSTEGVDTSSSTGEEDGSETIGGLIRGGVSFGQGWEARALLRVSQSTVEFDTDTDFDGLLNDTLNQTRSDQFLTGGTLTGAAHGLDHEARVSFSKVVRENSLDGVFTDETTGERTKLSYSPSKSWDSGDAIHRLTGLLAYEAEDYEREDTDTLFGDPNQSQSFDTIGIGAEYQLTKGALTLNASLRHDDNDGRFEDATTWRIGGAWRTEHWGRFRVSAGEGVKNPTFTELFGFFPGTFVGNPDLEPERSSSIEIGWDRKFGRGQIALAAFRAELEDEIYTAFNPDFTSTSLNREGDSEREGIEAEGQWGLTDSLTLYGSASAIASENDADEDEIRVPDWTASLGALWQSQARSGFTIGAALDAVGEQDDFDFGSFPSQRVTLDAYVLASATVTYPLTEKVSLTLRGENLFDEEVTDVFGYAQPGAGVFVGLRIN